MTVRAADDMIFLEGACPVEDAERLLALLNETADRRVDLSQCTRAHSAVVQLLFIPGVTLSGPIPQGFLGDWVVPGLQEGEA